MADIGDSKVEILPSGSDVRINIYNSSGDEVDSFDDTYLKNFSPVNINYDSYYRAMLTLLQSARRSATGADRIIDSMISSLGIPQVTDDSPF